MIAWVLQTEVTDGQTDRESERASEPVRPERRSSTTTTKFADGSGTRDSHRVQQIVLRSGGEMRREESECQ